jgi:diguanylate cyclase (GGDEF)-like protein
MRNEPTQREQLDELLQLRARQRFQLAFPFAFEERYRLQTSRRRDLERLCLNIGAIVLFDLFLITDAKSYPQFFLRAVLIRAVLFTPVALSLTLMMWRSRDAAVQELCQLLGIVLAGIAILGIVVGIGETYSIVGQCGMFLVIIYGALVVRMSFRSALAAILLLVTADFFLLNVALAVDRPALLACLLLLASCSAFALHANFRLERMERTNYLLLLREELHRHELSRANRHLTDLTQIDELTGLANRRRLDQFLEDAWSEAVNSESVISLVMADMDCFKRLNDLAGHLYGDQILQRFALVLRKGVRADQDLAARFGGEEFALVLPGRNEEMALAVAERLRQDVESQDLAHDAPVEGLRVTVSLGVATAYPTATGTPTHLIEAADAALYRAKSAGRNCVRVHDGSLVET